LDGRQCSGAGQGGSETNTEAKNSSSGKGHLSRVEDLEKAQARLIGAIQFMVKLYEPDEIEIQWHAVPVVFYEVDGLGKRHFKKKFFF